MKINPIRVKKVSAQNFGLQTDEIFNNVVIKARAEVFDTGIINPRIWDYTLNAVKKIKKTFPKGILSFRETPLGMVPILQPYGKLPYYKKVSANNPATIELRTILMGQGTIHGRDLRNLATELTQLEEDLAKTTKVRKK